MYPSLEAAAQELLVLNHFLGQLDDLQLALGVRQRMLTMVDAAIAAALEMETYMYLWPRRTLNTVSMAQKESGQRSSDNAIAGVAYHRRYTNQDPLQKVSGRLDKLELQLQTKQGSR